MDPGINNKKFYFTEKFWLTVFSNFERISVVFFVLLLSSIVFMGMVFRYFPLGTGTLTLATEELGNLCLVWLWLWAGAAVQRVDAHFRMTAVIDRLGKRSTFAISLANNTIVLLLMIVLIKLNFQQFIKSIGIRTMGMEWPVTLFVFPLLLGCPLIALYTFFKIIRLIKGGTSTL